MSAVPSRASWPAVSAAGGKFSGPLLVPSPIHEHRDGPGLGLVTRPGGVTITAPVSAVPRQVGRLLVPDRGIGLRRTRTPSRGSVGPGPAAPGRRRGSDPGAAIRARSYRRRGLGPTGPGVLRLQVGPLLDRREPPARGAAASASESRPLAAPARARPARASGTPGRPGPRAPSRGPTAVFGPPQRMKPGGPFKSLRPHRRRRPTLNTPTHVYSPVGPRLSPSQYPGRGRGGPAAAEAGPAPAAVTVRHAARRLRVRVEAAPARLAQPPAAAAESPARSSNTLTRVHSPVGPGLFLSQYPASEMPVGAPVSLSRHLLQHRSR